MRQLHSLYRRRYSVAGPQHLWHIDGNHQWFSAIHYSIFSSHVYICDRARINQPYTDLTPHSSEIALFIQL